jgi:tetratricopeptide (TPR) repeat protein
MAGIDRGRNVISGMAVIPVVAAIAVFLAAPLAHASQTLPADMHEWALKSIDLVFREDFRGAEAEAQKIIRAYPDHPAGYFFMAAVADAWMLRHQSNRREAEFYRYCDQAIERAERILANNPRDEWARFFLGGADGYKGTYEVRYERYITGFRFGWKGVSVFMRMAAEGSKNPDIQFGIGAYDYWRSALMKMLWWMPGVEDKRAEGIRKLRGVRQNGIYSRGAAAMVLIDIYINEELFQDALNVADDMLRQYPRALSFQWGRARALHGLRRHEEAITAYRQIFARVENDPNSNFFNLVQARMGMARGMAALGRNAEALEQLAAISGYTLTRDIRKRLESVLSEANTLRRRLERAS